MGKGNLLRAGRDRPCSRVRPVSLKYRRYPAQEVIALCPGDHIAFPGIPGHIGFHILARRDHKGLGVIQGKVACRIGRIRPYPYPGHGHGRIASIVQVHQIADRLGPAVFVQGIAQLHGACLIHLHVEEPLLGAGVIGRIRLHRYHIFDDIRKGIGAVLGLPHGFPAENGLAFFQVFRGKRIGKSIRARNFPQGHRAIPQLRRVHIEPALAVIPQGVNRDPGHRPSRGILDGQGKTDVGALRIALVFIKKRDDLQKESKAVKLLPYHTFQTAPGRIGAAHNSNQVGHGGDLRRSRHISHALGMDISGIAIRGIGAFSQGLLYIRPGNAVRLHADGLLKGAHGALRHAAKGAVHSAHAVSRLVERFLQGAHGVAPVAAPQGSLGVKALRVNIPAHQTGAHPAALAASGRLPRDGPLAIGVRCPGDRFRLCLLAHLAGADAGAGAGAGGFLYCGPVAVAVAVGRDALRLDGPAVEALAHPHAALFTGRRLADPPVAVHMVQHRDRLFLGGAAVSAHADRYAVCAARRVLDRVPRPKVVRKPRHNLRPYLPAFDALIVPVALLGTGGGRLPFHLHPFMGRALLQIGFCLPHRAPGQECQGHQQK